MAEDSNSILVSNLILLFRQLVLEIPYFHQKIPLQNAIIQSNVG